MSVFVEDWILASGKTVQELSLKFPNHRLTWMTVAEYEELGQTLEPAPVDDFFPGHAAVRDGSGRRSAGTKTKMAKRSRWLDEA